MARIRTIKPEFWTSEQVIELSVPACLLFIGMWNFCDDRGVMPATLRSLKAKVLPADDFTVAQIEGFVREMTDQGLIREFEANGERWWSVTGWRHQLINRPSASKFPEPPRTAPLPSEDRQVDEDSSRMPPSHSTAAVGDVETETGHENDAETSDSVSAHGVFSEDSQQEGKGKERKKRVRARENEPPDARGARLTLTELPADWGEWAKQEHPDLDPSRTWDLFADYWRGKPGKDGVKSDWPATWRNWVRRENASSHARVNGKTSVSDHNRSALDAWLGNDSQPVSATVIEGEFVRESRR